MHVGIVGAGITGQLLAYQLRQTGCKVTIFTRTDKRGTGSATRASAGMLVPLTEMHTAARVINQLGVRSIALWKAILPHLPRSVFYQFKGSFVTAHPADQAELTHFEQLVKAKMGQVAWQRLDAHSAMVKAADLNVTQGFYFPDDGHIESDSLIVALNIALSDPAQVTWQTYTQVAQVAPYQITTAQGSTSFDMVFDCRGYEAKSIFSDLRGVRGELLYLHAPDVHITYPVRLLTPRHPIYIVPLSGQRYIVGASEIESEDTSPISVRSTLALLTAAYTVHSGFAEARIIDSRVGLRPALSSNIPQIRHTKGLIAINGLYRHGFLACPAMVEMAVQLLENKLGKLAYPELVRDIADD